MIYTIKAEKHITIGITNNKIVEIDWREFSKEFTGIPNKEVKREISRYLKEADQFVSSIKGE